MKNVIAVAAALAAILFCASTETQAQTALHPGGFPYPGSSVGTGNFGFSFQLEREQPPFFAKYPPVYYSHAVKRPYGVSPYAAPAGVVPVELTHPLPAVNPVIIENPHVISKVALDVEAAAPVQPKPVIHNDKVAGWRMNPFFKAQANVVNGLVLN